MKKRFTLWLVAVVSVLSVLVPMAANAGASAAKLRPICVHHPLPGNLNLQIGYCP